MTFFSFWTTLTYNPICSSPMSLTKFSRTFSFVWILVSWPFLSSSITKGVQNLSLWLQLLWNSSASLVLASDLVEEGKILSLLGLSLSRQFFVDLNKNHTLESRLGSLHMLTDKAQPHSSSIRYPMTLQDDTVYLVPMNCWLANDSPRSRVEPLYGNSSSTRSLLRAALTAPYLLYDNHCRIEGQVPDVSFMICDPLGII